MLRTVDSPGLQHEHRLLMERVASSRYIGKSTRLRDLLVYLCHRVLEESAHEIHEQEVGCKVFGRSPDYDTTIDNIVRVHASQLRKRLEQYFAAEGLDEPWIIEIPKGNYAPVFRERSVQEAVLAVPEPIAPPAPAPAAATTDWRIWALAALVLIFASTTALLFVQARSAKK